MPDPVAFSSFTDVDPKSTPNKLSANTSLHQGLLPGEHKGPHLPASAVDVRFSGLIHRTLTTRWSPDLLLGCVFTKGPGG